VQYRLNSIGFVEYEIKLLLKLQALGRGLETLTLEVGIET
jgi:hypothetical protein